MCRACAMGLEHAWKDGDSRVEVFVAIRGSSRDPWSRIVKADVCPRLEP
jgi:hypothetical protein